jgi:pimeloyl-ACP methyl ester carboxylesterase
VLRRLLLLVVPVVAALAAAGHASAAGFTKTDTTIAMSDGVSIAATYFVPDGPRPAAGWPAVMIFHGLGQTRTSTELGNVSWNDVAGTLLAPNGYAVLTFDARAHGQSGGLFTLDGPRELQDTRELFAWLASHPEIDAKHVGAFGVSYGAGMILLAAVAGVPFSAIVAGATWNDLPQALAPGGVVRSGIAYGFARDIPPSKVPPEIQQLIADAVANRNLPAITAFGAARSSLAGLPQVHAPTFLIQGRRDFAFGPDQAIAGYRALAGPKRLYIGDLGHAPSPNPPAEWAYLQQEALQWLDRWLKGTPNGIDTRPPVELAPDPWSSRTLSAATTPPTRTISAALPGRTKLGAQGRVVRTATARVSHVETFGGATVRVDTTAGAGWTSLVGVLTAVAPGGKEILVADGAAPTTAGRHTVSIRFQPTVTSIPRGSRLRVYFGPNSLVQNSSNLVYLGGLPPGSTATLGRATLSVPVLRKPVSP